MFKYLSDLEGTKMTFKVIKTYHSIKRYEREDYAPVSEEDVYDKVEEALPELEKSWIDRNGSVDYFKELFSGIITSRSLKLNIVIDVRLDTQTMKPAIIITTVMIKDKFVPKNIRYIRYLVSKRQSPAQIKDKVYLDGSALLACDSTEGLEDFLLEDLKFRDLEQDVENGSIAMYRGKDGLVYCVDNRGDGLFYIVDINFSQVFPEFVINLD
jgi:hypothetical protein